MFQRVLTGFICMRSCQACFKYNNHNVYISKILKKRKINFPKFKSIYFLCQLK